MKPTDESQESDRKAVIKYPRESAAALNAQKVYRSCRTRRRLGDSAIAAEELWWQAIDYVKLNYRTTSLVDYLKPKPAQLRGCLAGLNASKVQKVYKSYRTRRRLADSAVVAEELWWQANDYVRLNYSSISFFNYLKPQSAPSRWNRVRMNASKVGKGLSKDEKAKKLAFQHWIEAIDPRHRYGHNLHLYYEEWCNGDAGQPFFYWLDIGDGRDVDIQECPRSLLRQQCIIYLGPKKKGVFHHSSFLAGGATLAAGRFTAENGKLKAISSYSGHFRPTEENLNAFLSYLEENGIKLDEIEIPSASNEDYYEDSNTVKDENVNEALAVSGMSHHQIPGEMTKDVSPEQSQDTQEGTLRVDGIRIKGNYKRTLSGGLQRPRADVPPKSVLQRINSMKATNSYQLGHQLSSKWSTGAGPRIGCVGDYPLEVRVQALEFVNLSPRVPPTPLTSWKSCPIPVS